MYINSNKYLNKKLLHLECVEDTIRDMFLSDNEANELKICKGVVCEYVIMAQRNLC